MRVEVDPLGPFNVAYIHHVGPYKNVGPIFGELWGWAKERDLIAEGTAMMGLSYDDPAAVPEDQLRYDVCIPVPYGTEGDERVHVREIPEGDYAQTTHIGSYDNMSDSFKELNRKAFEDDLYSFAGGPCIEIYLDDPEITPEAERRTLIAMPAKRSDG